MDFKDEINLWPRLNIEYLESEQVEHEVFIRNLPVTRNTYGTYSPAALKLIQKEIISEPYDPLSVGTLRIDSSEERGRQQMEFKRCKAGLGSIDNNQHTLEPNVVIHRTLHFLFRLERLNLLPLDCLEKKVGLRKRARELIHKYCFGKSDASTTKTKNDTLVDLDDEKEPIINDCEHQMVEDNEKNSPIKPCTPTVNTGAIPKGILTTDANSKGLESLITSLFPNFERKFNKRLSVLESQSSEKSSSKPSHVVNERIDRQVNMPISFNSRPSAQRTFAPNYDHEYRFPSDSRTDNNVQEPLFTPQVNSTYRRNSNYGSDASTFKKLDALSRWRLGFNGTTVDEKHMSLNDYITTIERFIALQKLNPDDVLPYLLPTISGNARIWYNAEGASIVTLKDFFQGLRNMFD